MIAQERTPALRRHTMAWSSTAMPGPVRADRARRDPQSELQPQLVGETPLAPGAMVTRHLLDEPVQLHRDRGPSRT